MKLGFCAWLLTGKSLPERVEFLAKEGFGAISWLQSVTDADNLEREEAACAIREYGLALTYHGNLQGCLTPDRKLSEAAARRVLDDVRWWQERTGAMVSCCSDQLAAAPEETGVLTYLPEETCRLFQLEADFLEPLGLGYGIENSFLTPAGNGYCFLRELRRQKALLKEAPNAGMIFDVGHAQVYLTAPGTEPGDGPGIADYIAALPFRICEVHVSDNHGLRDEHLTPGCGTVDFAALRAGLEKVAFDGVLSLEVCPDILSGLYAWDLATPAGRDAVKRIRDAFQRAFDRNPEDRLCHCANLHPHPLVRRA